MKNKCFGPNKVEIRVLRSESSCMHFKADQVFSLDGLVAQDTCLLAVHTALPYFLTIFSGGYFTFQWKYPWEWNRNFVVAQCPNPHGSVVMKFLKDLHGNNVSLHVTETRGECPKELAPGYSIDLAEQVFSSICPQAFNSLFPPYYALGLEGDKVEEPVKVYVDCSNCKAGSKGQSSEFLVYTADNQR